MIINIRGTNGSGKTTLARAFQNGSAQTVNLVRYSAPTKRDPGRHKWVTGVLCSLPALGRVLCVGSYSQAQGGMDTVPSFELQHQAVEMATVHADHVLCEGVLASTVAGSWLEFLRDLSTRESVAVGYMDTPVDLCLERIRERQVRAGKVREIKSKLVEDKHKSIAATRPKFDAAGIRTFDIPGRGTFGEDVVRRVLMGEM